MNIAIVDDNRQEAEKLERLIKEYQESALLDISVSHFSSGEEFLNSFERSQYTLVFLDIFMNKITGIETAEQLWKKDPQCLFVFLTTSQEHIWQAAQLHCFDYVLKDQLDLVRITKLLNDVQTKLPHLNRYLDFDSGKQSVHLPLNKIVYILSDNNYTIFGMENGREYRYRISFSNILGMLNEINFFLHCNRGIILNMNHIVAEEQDTYKMKDGQRFPIRKLDRNAIKHIYHDYQFARLEEM